MGQGLATKANVVFLLAMSLAAHGGISSVKGARGQLTHGTVCEASGRAEITVDCGHSAAAARGRHSNAPKIALEHAFIQFRPRNESHMRVELAFKNAGAVRVQDFRTVYIEFDDEAGRNYIRRPLPSVDLRQIAPGEVKEFSDVFLAPSLRPNRYIVQLWIPSSDAMARFDRSRDFLLSGAGVSEKSTGLNRIATITVQP
jgi:hypothetical protein